MQFSGKTALVTGAGSGLGKASAIALAKEGAKVAILARDAGELEETAREIERAGGEPLVLVADVSKPEDLQRAYEGIAGRWDRLDIVFANAGINGVWAPLEKLTPEEWTGRWKSI